MVSLVRIFFSLTLSEVSCLELDVTGLLFRPGNRQTGVVHDFDLLVIGSGPGGQKAAIAAAKLDRQVAVVDL